MCICSQSLRGVCSERGGEVLGIYESSNWRFLGVDLLYTRGVEIVGNSLDLPISESHATLTVLSRDISIFVVSFCFAMETQVIGPRPMDDVDIPLAKRQV